MALRQFAARVPELLEIHGRRALGGLDPERRQAARSARTRLMVQALHLFRQGEEGLGVVDGRVDDLLVQPVIRDHSEAIAFERGAQLIAEALEVGVVARHRNGLDAFGGNGSGVEGGGHGRAFQFVRGNPSEDAGGDVHTP